MPKPKLTLENARTMLEKVVVIVSAINGDDDSIFDRARRHAEDLLIISYERQYLKEIIDASEIAHVYLKEKTDGILILEEELARHEAGL